jgi:hypothetical protein
MKPKMVGERLKAPSDFLKELYPLGKIFVNGKAKHLLMPQHFGLSKGEATNEN